MNLVIKYYKLSDDRVWDVDACGFISDPSSDEKYQTWCSTIAEPDGFSNYLGLSGILAPTGPIYNTPIRLENEEQLYAALKFYNLPRPKTDEELAEEIRAERDRRIVLTDYMLLPDYPLTDATREELKEYRQYLRDIPEMEGFPWKGVDSAPWPEMPEIITK